MTEKIKKIPPIQRLSKKRVLITLLIFLAVGFFLIFQRATKKLEVEVASVSRENLTESQLTSGQVDAEKKATLTFPTSGKLSYVGISEGRSVKKGQLVASLDKTILEKELTTLLNTWEREFTDFDDSNDSIADSVLSEAVRRIKKRAQIDLDQSLINIEIKNEAIRLANLYSPISGVATKVNPNITGINIAPSTSLYEIVDTKSMYFFAEVSENDIPKIYIDQKVLITLDSYPEITLEGQVAWVGYQSITTSTGGTAYKVHISLPESEAITYRLGMNGDANFIFRSLEDVLSIPQGAIIEEGDTTYVWVFDKGKATKQKVKTGLATSTYTQIVEGLEESDQIIISPISELKENIKVKRKL